MIGESTGKNLQGAFAKWYPLACDYYNEHGNLLVPKAYKTEDGANLGIWIVDLRARYYSKTLLISQEEVDKLEKIGMVWDVPEYQWQQKYNKVKEFYDEYHDLSLLPLYKGEEGKYLLSWVKLQRGIYYQRKEGVAYQEKIAKLEAIGIICQHKDEKWDSMYKLACLYKDTYHNLLVPACYETAGGKKLGDWIRNQRSSYQNSLLSDERIEALNRIGMVWKVNENRWNLMYEEALKYYQTYHNLTILKNYQPMYVTKEELTSWLKNQKAYYKANKKLTKEQRQKLELVEIDRDKQKENWQELYVLATKYYQENGHLLVPRNYKEDGKSLGTWVESQRRRHHLKRLTLEQIESLKAIGIIWEPRKNLADIYAYIDEFNLPIDKNLNREVLNRISLIEFIAKTNYLLKEKQTLPIDDDGHLKEIFTMSSVAIENNPSYNLTLEEMIKLYGNKETLSSQNKLTLKL